MSNFEYRTTSLKNNQSPAETAKMIATRQTNGFDLKSLLVPGDPPPLVLNHQSPTETAKMIALRQNEGSEVKSLLAPPPVAPQEPIIKRKPKKKPKNFQKENRSALKEMQNQKKLLAASKAAALPSTRKMSQFKNIPSRVFSSDNSTTCRLALSSGSTQQSPIADDDCVSYQPSVAGSSVSSITNASTSTKNYLAMNKQDAMRPRPKPPPKEEKQRHHSSYGKVPAYVRKRKEELAERERIRYLEENPVDVAPEGMMLLSEQDRLETLGLLRQKEDSAQKELDSLSITGDSLKLKRKRDKLEAAMREINDAIKIFSKEKVYVQKPT
mmetsp:Transcript_24061/g.36104  ORF Transcript_24061/g.36104 Transcript_24061/m.36104 type:complete len:326 (-) Transcript_24061:7-984(-)